MSLSHHRLSFTIDLLHHQSDIISLVSHPSLDNINLTQVPLSSLAEVNPPIKKRDVHSPFLCCLLIEAGSCSPPTNTMCPSPQNNKVRPTSCFTSTSNRVRRYDHPAHGSSSPRRANAATDGIASCFPCVGLCFSALGYVTRRSSRLA
jgi:hypothetical protein